MSRVIPVDLFVEDRAHEEFLSALVRRIAGEHNKAVEIRVRSARGGHGCVLTELVLYQQSVIKRVGSLTMPDLLVIAIDANCQRHHVVRRSIVEKIGSIFPG